MNSSDIKKLIGPIAIFGSGGFIGSHLLHQVGKERSDVIGFSHNPKEAWRLKHLKIPQRNIATCDLLEKEAVFKSLKKYKPKTIFNLAAYGAYSWEKNVTRIYDVNLTSTANLIEILKETGFAAYIQAGSQSEYGLNAAGPAENDELIPNSHYAVSKTAVYHLMKYYGKIEKLPVVHMRLYSVYGPLEEKGRLIPTLIDSIRQGTLPPFVDRRISRDFVYVDDVVAAFITIASKISAKHFGEAYNVASGKKTTMANLAVLSKKIFNIKAVPHFGTMKKRDWDVVNWYGNPAKIKKAFNWKPTTSLSEGLIKCYRYGQSTKNQNH